MPLYSHLCQIVHPAAQSLMWFSSELQIEDGGSESFTLVSGDDKRVIKEVCVEFADGIEYSQMQSVYSSILTLQVLNLFEMSEVHTKTARQLPTSHVPLWKKIDATFMAQGVRGWRI